MPSKADYLDWKHHPVTEQVFSIVGNHIRGLEMELGSSAGRDSYQDALRVGAIRAYQDLLELDYEDTPND